MPRYYFDVVDSRGLVRDDVGMEFDRMEDAVMEARRALGSMVKDVLVDGAPPAAADQIEIRIRDGDQGPVVLTVTLSEASPAR